MRHERHQFVVPDDLRRPPDPILGLSRLCEQDHRPEKIDAGVGVYRDENGETFTPSAIHIASAQLGLGPVDYLSPSGKEEFLGDRTFIEQTARLVFDRYADELLEQQRLAAIGTPGGTGAVAVAFQLFRTLTPGAPLIIGTPTWPNHVQIAESQNIHLVTFPHMRESRYDLAANVSAIRQAAPDALTLFHTGKTHNPTGVNPSSHAQWRDLARASRKTLFDTAYAGFGDGLVADTEPIRIFMEEGVPLGVAVSYAKNGGIYNERPGCLLFPMSTRDDALTLQRLLNACARTLYSSPPARGERLIARVLSDPSLFSQWNDELARVSRDLRRRRELFAQALPELSSVAKQTGLFSMLPLHQKQVERLRKEHAVYIPSNGRVNFGGIPQLDIPRFAKAIEAVL